MESRSKVLVPTACKQKWKNSLGVHSLDTEEKHWAQCFADLGFLISGSSADVAHCEQADLSNAFAVYL